MRVNVQISRPDKITPVEMEGYWHVFCSAIHRSQRFKRYMGVVYLHRLFSANTSLKCLLNNRGSEGLRGIVWGGFWFRELLFVNIFFLMKLIRYSRVLSSGVSFFMFLGSLYPMVTLLYSVKSCQFAFCSANTPQETGGVVDFRNILCSCFTCSKHV